MKYDCYFFLSVPVCKLGSLLSNPRLEKLTSNHIPLGGEQGDDNIQTLVYNNSQETKTLRGNLWALKSQVFLLFSFNSLLYTASVQFNFVFLHFRFSLVFNLLTLIYLL